MIIFDYMKTPKNRASGTRLTRVSNQDGTDVHQKRAEKGN